MSSQITQLTVFIASPSDVSKERETVRKVCAELNSSVAPFRHVILSPVGWETHCWPDVRNDVQSVISSQIQPEDIFVGILWNRFGTPTPRAASGTAEEFAIAYKNWQSNKVSNLLLYFKKQTSTEDLDQPRLVRDFKENILKRGLFYKDFDTRNQFEREIRQHLTNIILRRNPTPLTTPSGHLSIDFAQLSAELDAQLLIDSHTGLVYIDLDDFGRLNQKLGIARADEVLFSIIQSLAAVCKVESFTFHRVLGDQFAIFVNGKRDVLEAARKLTMEIRNLPVTASLGTVRGVGENADVMIRRALRGAELSKRNGKNQITDQTYPGHRTPVPAISAYEFS